MLDKHGFQERPSWRALAGGARPEERYTIRRKFFRILGAGFHIYDAEGGLVGYCDQKRLRLREDLRVYTDESKSEELMRIGTQQVIDFGATYEMSVLDDETGEQRTIGSVRRKGLKSLLRDEWLVFNAQGEQRATIREDSQLRALARRAHELVAMLIPQGYHMIDGAGEPVASYRTHFNPVVHRLGVSVHREDEDLDDLLILGAGVLLLAIEGRQD